MPLLSRTAVRTRTTLYALSVLAIFCSNPSAAEPTTLALLRPQPISPLNPPTQINCPSGVTHTEHVASCRGQKTYCIRFLKKSESHCEHQYDRCMSEC
jgi:hypothetical protein